MILEGVHGNVGPGCSVCGDDNSQYYDETGMCYVVVPEEKTWQEASQACIFRGGSLAMPKTASINRILIEIIRKFLDQWNDFWFGLWYNNVAVEWYWVEGTPLGAGYENFIGPPPADPDHCACIVGDGGVSVNEDDGEWISALCTLEQPFICEIPYDSPCEGGVGFYCPETALCYCLNTNQPLKSWQDARASCWGWHGDLAISDSAQLNYNLRNLVHDFEDVDWEAWIAGFYDIGRLTWVWAGSNELIMDPFENFDDWPYPGDQCAIMDNKNHPAGMWTNKDCLSTHWFFCMAYGYLTACCDPHFVVKPRGMKEHVCFDYYGKDNDVIQLVSSRKYELAVNGEVFSHQHTKKTWFGALSFIARRCEIVADTRGIRLNDKPMDWIDIEDQPCGRSGVTYSIRDDLHRSSTHLIIHVMPGVEFVFTKDQKTYKFGTVEYMDLDMTKHYGLDETTDGILGEFMGMTVKLDEDSVKNDTDTGILYFPDEPGRGSVTAHRVGRKNLLTNEHFHCWNVEDEGAGLVRGTARDYLVPDLFTGQKAQNLRLTKEEEAADAIF